MGCFFTCFSAGKHRKRRHLVNFTPSKDHRDGKDSGNLQLDEPTKQEVAEEPVKPITESKEKLEEQLCSNGRKKVTFDLNIKKCETLSTKESTDNVLKNNEAKVSEVKEEKSAVEIKSISKSITSDVASYPPTHRYQNCANEEYRDVDLGDSDLDDASDCGGHNGGGDDQVMVLEESSESLFSISIDSRKQTSGAELSEKEVTSPIQKCGSDNEGLETVGSNRNARDRSQYGDSVLNPVEILNQRKAVTAKANLPLQHQDKENINAGQDFDIGLSPEPSFKLLTSNSRVNASQKVSDQEIAVNTSLSSWLVESRTTPMSKVSINSGRNSPSGRATSPKCHEDRPILGALGVEELKQLSTSTSPRRQLMTPNPDERPIVGTVGSYWRHTGQIMDSSDSGYSSKGMQKTRTRMERMRE